MAERKWLHLGPDIRFPLSLITQTIALLAVKRAGKSNAAAVMAEDMHRAGLPWVAIDPKGDWWGLRSSADGTGPGLPVPVFGGLHGDMDLTPDSGPLLAELIVEMNLTCILDVSQFSKGELARFLVAFGERLFRLHQKEPQPRMLFLEECDEYCPQKVMREMARCVGMISKMVKQGGSFGLGVAIISQRAAVVNKDILTQVDGAMIALRTTSPQDRKAIRDWMDVHAVVSEVVDSLPSLADGEAWISSPHWLPQHGLDPLQRARFRQRETFDSGATPQLGKQRRAATIADIDLTALAGRMAAVTEQAAANDPAALKRKVAALERQLKSGAPSQEAAELRADIADLRRQLAEALSKPPQQIEVQAVSLEQYAALADLASTMSVVIADLVRALDRVQPSATQTPAAQRPALVVTPRAPERSNERSSERSSDAGSSLTRVPASNGTAGLRAGERTMLSTLSQQYPLKITKAQLASLSRFKASGGTFRTYLGTLKRLGLVTTDNEYVVLTDDGFTATGTTSAEPITTAEIREVWSRVLRAGERAILEVLLERYPQPVSRAELAAVSGFEASGGTFRTYVGTLRRNGLAEEADDGLVAASMFFEEARNG